jgi:hypothetical protein
MRRRFDHRPHPLAGSLLLLALVLRALIPVGFMPSPERPFTLSFCPGIFPPQWLAHAHVAHHGAHSAGASENSGPEDAGSHGHTSALAAGCIFAAYAVAATPPDVQSFADLPEQASAALPHVPRHVSASEQHRPQQPRAPPSSA